MATHSDLVSSGTTQAHQSVVDGVQNHNPHQDHVYCIANAGVVVELRHLAGERATTTSAEE